MKDISCIRNIKIREMLKKIDNKMVDLFKGKLRNIILYGSYARNENTAESDINFLVLVNEDENKIREHEDAITDIMVDLSLEYSIVISIYTQSVSVYESQIKILPFFMNVQREGINVHFSDIVLQKEQKRVIGKEI
ncbi:nucleotidyltransferase domain-containing protein [Clostridium akagii]|uniref:nucleotidyltransferase domain-containing protein n=1 Tax=Clostridium akagii TaxID=91623 RepID=UPI0004792594|nr:nucleotidyltransferase domain-containing protein [Clostridium akagii]